MYDIESGVAVPSSKGNSGSGKYPFAKMKVGDMFKFDSFDRVKVGVAGNRWNSKWKRQGSDLRFITRKIDENKSGCWLVETKED